MSIINKIFRTRSNDDSFCSAVVLAAGHSERMGRDKILMPLGGIPVIAHTLRALQASDCISEIVVVTKYESLQEIADICHDYGITKASRVMLGGRTRLESSLIGVSSTDKRARYIAIHDGARPFITDTLIQRVVHSAQQHDAAAPAVAPTDTVRILNAKGVVTETPSRELVALMQTPQVFMSEMIKAALTRAQQKGARMTDDCSAVEAMGYKVTVVAGDPDNIKLTTSRDLYIAEGILAERSGR